MSQIIEWFSNNTSIVFSGLGTAIVVGLLGALLRSIQARHKGDSASTLIEINNQINNDSRLYYDGGNPERDLSQIKLNTRILFIDDEKFKTVDNIKRAGWVHTKRMSDVYSVDDPSIIESDILFVDIQGVGIKAGFKDEGLGLASAIKDKYPQKKVIIYSAETKGDRFHESLRKADDFLKKNADAYQFQQIIEKYALDND